MGPYAVLSLVFVSLVVAAFGLPSPCEPNPFPLYWDVYGAGAESDLAVRFAIVPKNMTQTGGSCSTRGCHPWGQGAWPVITMEGHVRNGGVPENADLEAHVAAIREQLPKWIPDPSWTGNAVLDFEQWTNVWDLNFGNADYHAYRYCQMSMDLVKKAHPDWSHAKVQKEAKAQFETAATEWMVRTLEVCREVRPNAKWGFYGFPFSYPWCIPAAKGEGYKGWECGFDTPIAGEVLKKYSDKQQPIFDASTALYPSVYTFEDLPAVANPAYVYGVIKETQRVRVKTPRPDMPIYAYMQQKYHSMVGLVPPAELDSTMRTIREAGGAGIVMWGDIHHLEPDYRSYVLNATGPLYYKFLEELCNSTTV